MDRSFLSDKGIIRASRGFVCARLATYENKEEAEYLGRIFRGRSGQLENTVFCIMSPDGKDRLVRTVSRLVFSRLGRPGDQGHGKENG